MDPYKISGPAVVSFSGGRTSAYMLRKILDAHDNALPQDVHVLFANTGKERNETLDFVRDCSVNWGVEITWLEYRAGGEFVEVTHATASRSGEPFEAIIGEYGILPNAISRFCTAELKVRTMKRWMVARGYEHWTMVVGLRADEPRRAIRAKAPQRERWENSVPLYDAGVSEADVLAFWSQQPFDLQLRSYEGNCDLCFLKAQGKLLRLLEERPESAGWWIAQEERFKEVGRGGQFRADRPKYAALAESVRKQTRLPLLEADDALPCACTD